MSETMAELGPAAKIIVLCMALAVIFAVSGVVIRWARRQVLLSDACQAGPAGFSMERLAQLHKIGQISSGEYKMLRMKAMGLADKISQVNSSLSQPLDGDDEDQGQMSV